MDREGFGCETLERENHDAESGCGKIRGDLVSVYAPQSGRSKEEKEEFFTVLGKILSDIVGERLLICEDMNGHVGAEVDGFEGVHGGYGFGRRNVYGEMLLEFADALDLAIVNTWFKKEVRKMITYETKACKTVIDFFLNQEEGKETGQGCQGNT